MGRIGIYGGTFNPPHTGHMLALREFAEKLQLDRVLLIPDRVPPHKEMPEGSPDGQTRLRLCQLAAEGLPFVEVSDLELHREGRSYTVDTVRELAALYPDDERIFLMGTDMFLSFDRWYKPEEIVRYVSLGMANRQTPSETEKSEILAQKEKLEQEMGATVYLTENDLIEISSSAVRLLLRYGAGAEVLPEPVYREILRLNLYRAADDLRCLSEERLREEIRSLHKPRRLPHVEGCCELSVHLAEKWGADPNAAARAALLHDCTKILSASEQLILCRRYGILLDDFDRQNESLLHAKTGAAVAAQIFGETPEVCEAIRWHTTGKAGMTKLQKILYLADMIEKTRSYPGVEELRKLAESDLEEAVLQALQRTVAFVREGGKPLHPDSLRAMEYELERKQQSNALRDQNEVDV